MMGSRLPGHVIDCDAMGRSDRMNNSLLRPADNAGPATASPLTRYLPAGLESDLGARVGVSADNA